MRKCKYLNRYNLQLFEGIFHQWGTNMKEFESGGVNYTVGIIENPDGSIATPLASDIVFLD